MEVLLPHAGPGMQLWWMFSTDMWLVRRMKCETLLLASVHCNQGEVNYVHQEGERMPWC